MEGLSQEEAARVVDAIDRCLDRHIVHSYVNKALRSVTALHRGIDGELRLRRQDVKSVAPAVARELAVPPWLFDGVLDFFDSFDFDGDGTLDETETKRLFKKMLQQRRRELGGRRSVNVPVKSVEEAGYEIIKELGRGGQGTMYLCTKRSWYFMSHQYCVKFYEKACANAGGIDELMDEYELMISLNNEYIARTYEVFQDNLFYYLVNEPYFGGDLTKLGKAAYDKGVKMTEGWWRGLFKQCLDGLNYLHSKGVMHCDIKEPNIMIAKDDSFMNPRPVLIDFGLSTAFTSTREGVCGTPGYIPPETWQNGAWYVRGDIFSLGIVFFQLISGQVPSKNGAIQGVLVPADGSNDFARAALAQPLPWDLFPATMPLLADLLELMTRRDREERPRASVALRHAWFSSRGDAELPPENLQLLVGIACGHKIQEQLASQLRGANNLDQLRMAEKKFQEADVHGRGTVDARTAMTVLTQHGVAPRVAKECVDAAGGGAFPYKAITVDAIAGKENHGYHYIKDLFDKLDIDKSGTLSLDELRPLLTSDAFELGDVRLDEVMSFMDSDGDGLVSFEEFARACLAYGRIANRVGGSANRQSQVAGRASQSSPHAIGSVTAMHSTTPSAHHSMTSLSRTPRRSMATPMDSLIGRRWQLRVSILSARCLRGRAGTTSYNALCSCRVARDQYPSFETPVCSSLNPRWDSEQIISYIVGDPLEFSVKSRSAQSAIHSTEELLGTATLRWEQFFPYGFHAELTLVCPGSGIGGLLQVGVVVFGEESHAPVQGYAARASVGVPQSRGRSNLQAAGYATRTSVLAPGTMMTSTVDVY